MVRATDAPLRFDVTRAHIGAGSPGSVYACPIAIAGGQALGRKVAVCADEIWCGGSMWQTDAFIREWVRRFDEGEAVEPFTIELTIQGEACCAR